jgi:5-methylcytosine-specific restriction endonuclease McrA
MNSRITKKERGLIKGKINSIFSRSELRLKVLNRSVVPHMDPNRPRVKTWCRCAGCGLPEAKSYMDVDHIKPKIGVTDVFDEMSFDLYIDRVWCPESNLQVLCQLCHTKKTTAENALRRRAKKRGKPTKKNKLSKRNTRR